MRSAKLLHVDFRFGCETDDAIRGLDLQVLCGLSRMLLCFFFAEREIRFCTMCKEAPLSTMYILSFDYHRFVLGCLRIFDRKEAIEDLCFVRVCISTLFFCRCFPEIPSPASSKFLLGALYSLLLAISSRKEFEVFLVFLLISI